MPQVGCVPDVCGSIPVMQGGAVLSAALLEGSTTNVPAASQGGDI